MTVELMRQLLASSKLPLQSGDVGRGTHTRNRSQRRTGRARAIRSAGRLPAYPIAALSATSDPIDAARGLLSLYPFETFYIADLDAIESVGKTRVRSRF
jgi:hypothetical protein